MCSSNNYFLEYFSVDFDSVNSLSFQFQCESMLITQQNVSNEFLYGVYEATFMIQLLLFLPENWNNTKVV